MTVKVMTYWAVVRKCSSLANLVGYPTGEHAEAFYLSMADADALCYQLSKSSKKIGHDRMGVRYEVVSRRGQLAPCLLSGTK